MAATHSRSGRPSIRLRCVVFAAACAVAMSDGENTEKTKELELHLQHWSANCHTYYVHELLNGALSQNSLKTHAEANAQLDQKKYDSENAAITIDEAKKKVMDAKAVVLQDSYGDQENKKIYAENKREEQHTKQTQPKTEETNPTIKVVSELAKMPQVELDFAYVVQPNGANVQDLELLAKIEVVETVLEQVAELPKLLSDLIFVNTVDNHHEFRGKVKSVTDAFEKLKFEVKPKGLPNNWGLIRAKCAGGDELPMLIYRGEWIKTGGGVSACTDAGSSYIVASFKGQAAGDNAQDKFIVAGLHVHKEDVPAPAPAPRTVSRLADGEPQAKFLDDFFTFLNSVKKKQGMKQVVVLVTCADCGDDGADAKMVETIWRTLDPDTSADSKVRTKAYNEYAVITNFANDFGDGTSKPPRPYKIINLDTDAMKEHFPTSTQNVECGEMVVWKITANHGKKGVPHGATILVLVSLAVLASWFVSWSVKPEEDAGKQKDEIEMAQQSSGNK